MGTGLSLPRLGTGTQQQGLEIKQAKGEQPAGECSRALLSRFLSPLSGQTCLSPCAQPWGWPEVLSRTRHALSSSHLCQELKCGFAGQGGIKPAA